MIDRRNIMSAAWRTYRYHVRIRQLRSFDRSVFAECLRYEWAGALKVARELAERASAKVSPKLETLPAVPKTAPQLAMEAEIDGLKYLSFRYNIARMERGIRSRYAAAA